MIQGCQLYTMHPTKDEPNQIHLTLRGNVIDYPEDVGMSMVDMLLVKMLLNSIISKKDAKFVTIHTSNFYWNT